MRKIATGSGLVVPVVQTLPAKANRRAARVVRVQKARARLGCRAISQYRERHSARDSVCGTAGLVLVRPRRERPGKNTAQRPELPHHPESVAGQRRS